MTPSIGVLQANRQFLRAMHMTEVVMTKRSDLFEVSICEVCGNQRLTRVLDLGLHPLCDDLVPIGDARVCHEYPIDILFCENCLTAHQRFQVPKQDLFPPTYHYRSRFTADVLTGMQSLVETCERRFGSLAHKKVLDIGCNDGSLLDFFRQKGALTFGIEPTDAVYDAEKKGHRTYNTYLSEEAAKSIVAEVGEPDLITFTNVFAHIEDLRQVVAALKLLSVPSTVIVIENHYLGAVLNGAQFDTFYHEHPRSYSYTSFDFVARARGTQLLHVEFHSRYGGNIRVFLGSTMQNPGLVVTRDDLLVREKKFLQNFDSLNRNMNTWRATKGQYLNDLVRRYGKIPAKAFPGRAAILIKLLGLNEDMISAVYEKPGSMKIGHYVPGTRISIRSDDELLTLPDKSLPLLNLAWHISGEIHSYLENLSYTGPVIDVIASEDFQ